MDKYDEDEEEPERYFYNSQEDTFSDAQDGTPLSNPRKEKTKHSYICHHKHYLAPAFDPSQVVLPMADIYPYDGDSLLHYANKE